MGRPPCCDKIGVKKGPWTPDEDIILVSYVQQHGAANWRSIPTHTGLLRCSKSCRLRWTNYLRPGIKRGNFTDHEDKMIIHLQALLGNRWAAIASYLQQRTDNDIKNYWNTHLKKKLKKLHDGQNQDGFCSTASIQPKGQWERRLQTDIHLAKQALCEALSLDNKPNTTTTISKTSNSYNHQEQTITPSTPYASSAENIERLLQSWMRNPPKPRSNSSSSDHGVHGATATTTTEGLDSMFSYSSSNSDASQPGDGIGSLTPEEINTLFQDESKPNIEGTAGTPTLEHVIPLSLLEKWLFDENGASDQDPDEDLINMSLEDHSCLF